MIKNRIKDYIFLKQHIVLKTIFFLYNKADMIALTFQITYYSNNIHIITI
jgi:hypothetical protein